MPWETGFARICDPMSDGGKRSKRKVSSLLLIPQGGAWAPSLIAFWRMYLRRARLLLSFLFFACYMGLPSSSSVRGEDAVE